MSEHNCTNWGIGRPARLCLQPKEPRHDCTNWGIGRPARLLVVAVPQHVYCTNWGIGRPARPLRYAAPSHDQLYQLGNWKAGKTRDARGRRAPRIVPTGELEGRQDQVVGDVISLADCTNWGIGRPARRGRFRGEFPRGLYQLGNWKAGKTRGRQGRRRCTLYQLGNWKAGKTRMVSRILPS